ncbi:MAG: hypothetical protein LBI83_18900 [Stenotrophomonas maltophilia]|jgi:hypothetical protein|nr:hypothetical protein [Stenotrophomonas maltophilia]
MSKIPMIRGNRVVSVDARLAPLLERHGGYQRRDMQAQPAVEPASSRAAAPKRAAASPKKAAKKAAPKRAADKEASE